MSAEVRVLKTERADCLLSVIATLEEALRQAREGDIVAVGVAVVRPTGAVNASFSQMDVAPTLLGATMVLTKRVLEALGE